MSANTPLSKANGENVGVAPLPLAPTPEPSLVGIVQQALPPPPPRVPVGLGGRRAVVAKPPGSKPLPGPAVLPTPPGMSRVPVGRGHDRKQ